MRLFGKLRALNSSEIPYYLLSLLSSTFLVTRTAEKSLNEVEKALLCGANHSPWRYIFIHPIYNILFSSPNQYLEANVALEMPLYYHSQNLCEILCHVS